MTKAKHTPRPWVVDEQGEKHFLETNHWWHVHGPIMRIACIEGMGEEYKANAHLIAASPDMFAALEKIEEWLMNGWSENGLKGEAVHHLFREAVELSRAARSQARGELS